MGDGSGVSSMPLRFRAKDSGGMQQEGFRVNERQGLGAQPERETPVDCLMPCSRREVAKGASPRRLLVLLVPIPHVGSMCTGAT